MLLIKYHQPLLKRYRLSFLKFPKKTVYIFKMISSDYSIECWIMQKAYFTVKNVESVNISMFNCVLKCFWKRKIIWLFKKLKRLFSDTYFFLLKTCFVKKVFLRNSINFKLFTKIFYFAAVNLIFIALLKKSFTVQQKYNFLKLSLGETLKKVKLKYSSRTF